jgi:hypothetical protein
VTIIEDARENAARAEQFLGQCYVFRPTGRRQRTEKGPLVDEIVGTTQIIGEDICAPDVTGQRPKPAASALDRSRGEVDGRYLPT